MNLHSTYHYVPIINLLKNVVSVPDVYEQIQKYQHGLHHPDVLYYRCDVDCQWSSDVSSKLSLKLQLYVDEFEVCNPVCPKHGKYKLTGVYFTIGNLSKRYRNTSNTVFLCMHMHQVVKQFDPTYQCFYSFDRRLSKTAKWC